MIKCYSFQSALTIEITRTVKILVRNIGNTSKHEHLNQQIMPKVLKQLSNTDKQSSNTNSLLEV